MIEFVQTKDDLIFAVRVIPKSSRSEIVGEHGGALKVKLNAPPVDGAANTEMVKILAKTFLVPKNAVEIVGGQTSKLKKVRITGGAVEVLQNL